MRTGSLIEIVILDEWMGLDGYEPYSSHGIMERF
jgi:hypothetical protein